MGTQFGLFFFDGNDFVEVFEGRQNRTIREINDLAESRNGTIWAATEWGLFKQVNASLFLRVPVSEKVEQLKPVIASRHIQGPPIKVGRTAR